MNNQRLQDAFIFVRATFFPGWDIKKEWKVKHDPEMLRQENIENKELYEFLKKAGVPYQQDAYAQNYSNEKIIVVFKMPKANKFLYELLIHEICHSHGRGGAWQDLAIEDEEGSHQGVRTWVQGFSRFDGNGYGQVH